jgi:flagellar motor protein MotB
MVRGQTCLVRGTVIAALLAPLAGGCAQNPFRKAEALAPPSLEPPPGVAAPAHTMPQASLTPSPSYADVDGRQMQAALVRSRQESQLMQDEIAALRDQLASTSSQLAQTRSTAMPVAPRASGPVASDPAAAPAGPGVTPTSPAAMQSSLDQLALPDLAPRFDGSVVRIDIPADKLFEAGTANLLPGGAAVLTQVANELERIYPDHFVGIEGHIDTEPLQNASWASPHQLTAAWAAAVFDFMTTRTSMHERQLFLVAHGANHPLVSNATAVGRARNRRVELVVYPDRAPGSAPAAGK